MKRSTWDGASLVYRYGCPSSVDGKPVDLPELAIGQLLLAHRLRNDLVAVEYRYADLLAAIWAAHPQVAVAQAAVDEAAALCTAVADRVKAERVADRSTRSRPVTRVVHTAMRQALRDAKAALKAVKAEAEADTAELRREAAGARRAALKVSYQEAVEAGLFWGTANAVADDASAAAKLVGAARGQGRAAQRRFRRWDGSGTLSTQVMSGAGKPARTPELLASGAGPWRNVVRLPAAMSVPIGEWPKGRGPHRYAEITVQVVKGGGSVTLPIVVHRPLPAGCEVTDVQITRRMVAGQPRLSVALTVRLPHPEPRMTGQPVGVLLSWASTGSAGGVRVARVSGLGGMLMYGPLVAQVETENPGMIVAGDGWVDVCAPPGWLHVAGRDDSIRECRDRLLDELRPQVVDALADGDLAEMVGVSAGLVARWRSPRRFVTLSRAWPQPHPLYRALAEWRDRDRHLWQYEAHERDQLAARRRDAWRKVAAWICGQASEVVIDGWNVARLKTAPALGVEDTWQARAGRRQAQLAAPGEFRAAIAAAAQRRGIVVTFAGSDK